MLQKNSKLTTKQFNRYKQLLKKVKDSDDLYKMRSLLTSYIDRGLPYIVYTNRSSSTRNVCVIPEDMILCGISFRRYIRSGMW